MTPKPPNPPPATSSSTPAAAPSGALPSVIARTSPYSPAAASTVGGFDFDATSDMWKQVCSVLPCDRLMAWPKYDTATYETTIDGTDVVIQCWKGLCEDLVSRIHLPPPFGTIDFPGGFGAEVGVYVRDPGRDLAFAQLPAFVSGWPPLYRAMVTKWFAVRTAHLQLLDGNDFWWPADAALMEAAGPVSFSMSDPVYGSELISNYSTGTYWTCEWMRPESWFRWIGEWVLHHRALPTTWPSDYILSFTVAGVKYTWDGTGIRPV